MDCDYIIMIGDIFMDIEMIECGVLVILRIYGATHANKQTNMAKKVQCDKSRRDLAHAH